ncbi:MAG: hypothetical protein AB8H86_01035 [Polyangiales bacterium]
MLHITLVTFRDDVDTKAMNKNLVELAGACADVNVLKPIGVQAERSWDACVEVRGSVDETLASAPWAELMSALVAAAEVHKAWTFGAALSS